MCRAGIQIFWAEADRHFPHARVTAISAIVLLLGLCLLLTEVVQAPLDYLHDAARQLHDAGNYVHCVLPADGSPPCCVADCRIRCCRDRKSTRLNSRHSCAARLPSSASETTNILARYPNQLN